MSDFKNRIELSPEEQEIITEKGAKRREEEAKRREYINILDNLVLAMPKLEEPTTLRKQYPNVLTDEEFKAIYEIAKTIKTMPRDGELYIRLLDYIGFNHRYDPANKSILRLVDASIKDMKATPQSVQWSFNAERILKAIEQEDRINDPTVRIADPKTPVDD